jgi:ketosteroid isomerase-like protein
MNLLRNLIFGFLSIYMLITLVVGCTASQTSHGFFDRESERLDSPERRLLVETLRVIVLLEEYHEALEAKDIEALMACYSPNYTHYDKGLHWQEEQLRERYFALFGELSVSFRDITIEFIRKETGYWMRQEDFDWLRTRETLPLSGGSYLILLDTQTGPVEMALGESLTTSPSMRRQENTYPSGNGSSDTVPKFGARKVTVRSSVDHGVERSMGEISFRMLLKGKLAGCDGSEVFTSSLEEKVILLLEKEEGEWKIISHW